MADGTRLKLLDESLKNLQGRFDDFQQNSDNRHEQTTKHLEALDSKLDKTLLILADSISTRQPPPTEISSPPCVPAVQSPPMPMVPPTTPPGFTPMSLPPSMFMQPSQYPYQLAASPRSTRVEFPRFDGTDPLDWIYKAKRYFEFYQVPPYQRLLLASIHMDGPGLPWFQWQHKTHQFNSWEDFTKIWK